MRHRLLPLSALAVALVPTGCTSTVAGTAAPVGGALTRLTEDVDLQLTQGSEGRLEARG